jgi:Spy/CpxP family protein refolding chaperone
LVHDCILAKRGGGDPGPGLVFTRIYIGLTALNTGRAENGVSVSIRKQDMKFIRQSAVAALCAASYAAFLVPASAADQPPAAAQHGPGAAPGPGPGERGPGMPDAPFEHRPFDHWPRGPMGVPGHLRHLDLSEAQQDKLFAIMHAAAPRRREQDKAERKAHEALRALSGEARFDEAKAAAAARDLGQAVAAGALLRSRVEAQVLAVLTPEQRERLRRDRPDERR